MSLHYRYDPRLVRGSGRRIDIDRVKADYRCSFLAAIISFIRIVCCCGLATIVSTLSSPQHARRLTPVVTDVDNSFMYRLNTAPPQQILYTRYLLDRCCLSLFVENKMEEHDGSCTPQPSHTTCCHLCNTGRSCETPLRR